MTSSGKRNCIKCHEDKWASSAYDLDPEICRPCKRKELPDFKFQLIRRECLKCSKIVDIRKPYRVCNECKKSSDYTDTSEFSGIY